MERTLLCFLRVDKESPAVTVEVVAKDQVSAGPLPLLPGGRLLVPCPLRDDFSLELGERQQNIERQPSERGSRVELLGYRHETDALLFEQIHHPGEVAKRPAEAVHFINHDTIELAGPGYLRCRRFKAGRSILAPVYPPSSYPAGSKDQPSPAWLRM